MQPVNVSAAQTWRACACLLVRWMHVHIHVCDSISHDPTLKQKFKKKEKRKEIWALHVLPSFLNTIRSSWLGFELQGEMESCFRNSAEEERVYVVADDWISLDCSFINSSLTAEPVALIRPESLYQKQLHSKLKMWRNDPVTATLTALFTITCPGCITQMWFDLLLLLCAFQRLRDKEKGSNINTSQRMSHTCRPHDDGLEEMFRCLIFISVFVDFVRELVRQVFFFNVWLSAEGS